jgi:hypothetical protein
MSGLIRKSLDNPEEVRPFEQGSGRMDLVNLDSGPIGRGTFEPGWQWSKHVKPSSPLPAARQPTWAMSSRAT